MTPTSLPVWYQHIVREFATVDALFKCIVVHMTPTSLPVWYHYQHIVREFATVDALFKCVPRKKVSNY